MDLTIAINSYKNTELLKLCIDSIKKRVSGLEYEIIVADSDTPEETVILMREEYPDIKFFPYKDNVGFQVLLKKGLTESAAQFVLALNSDIIVTENSVEKMLAYMKNHPDVGLAGPKLVNFNGTLQYSCFRFYKLVTIAYRRTFLKNFSFAQKHLDWFLMKDYDHTSVKEVDWIMGSALIVSKKAVKEVGHMDSRFFMYMEDVDWCRRFWEKKYKVMYLPESLMHHYHGKASARGGFLYSIFFNRLTWIHISSAIKYFLKYWGKPLPKHN